MRRVGLVLAVLAALFDVCGIRAAEKAVKDDMFIECVLGENNVYERQPVPVVITLFTTNPDVQYAEVVSEPRLSKGEFASVQQVQPAGSPYRRDIGGREYYCIPLKAFMFTVDRKGSYELSGGGYNVGVAYPVVVTDPFWGRIKTTETKEYEIPVRKTSFKVRSLPSPPADINFSGSVGEFSIETVVPRGDIYLNEEATAIIILKGTGMIAELTMPEYRDAFKQGLKLRSVSESRGAAYDRGRMLSELQLECTFIPTSENDVEIGVVSFDYFDSSTGTYRRAESKPVKIKVKSTVSRRESIDV